jgi:hypothetical protein
MFPGLLWNPKVHYSVCKIPQLIPNTKTDEYIPHDDDDDDGHVDGASLRL